MGWKYMTFYCSFGGRWPSFPFSASLAVLNTITSFFLNHFDSDVLETTRSLRDSVIEMLDIFGRHQTNHRGLFIMHQVHPEKRWFRIFDCSNMFKSYSRTDGPGIWIVLTLFSSPKWMMIAIIGCRYGCLHQPVFSNLGSPVTAQFLVRCITCFDVQTTSKPEIPILNGWTDLPKQTMISGMSFPCLA